jgi:hypothetical protein
MISTPSMVADQRHKSGEKALKRLALATLTALAALIAVMYLFEDGGGIYTLSKQPNLDRLFRKILSMISRLRLGRAMAFRSHSISMKAGGDNGR